ncbi:MAG: hypothetical protein JNJ58_14120 [Chitinophagaceae bacterium]|nr:hypothetical protein [Chitinophagaceae bacterium]
MEQPRTQPAWTRNIGIFTGLLLAIIGGGALIFKASVNKTLAIFMLVYGLFRMGFSLYQMKKQKQQTTE